MWRMPKTDWTKDDYFNLTPDYERIKGNVEHLRNMAVQLYKRFYLSPIGNYRIQDLPYAEFLNTIEKNVDLLAEYSFRDPDTKPMATWEDNEFIWNWQDLNRIEGNLQLLYRDLTAEMLAKQSMSFTLGSQNFGAARIGRNQKTIPVMKYMLGGNLVG